MPTYQYVCTECGHAFEQVQSFSDDSLTTCPQCQGALRKVFSAVGVVFKGSGFYRTDSRDGASKTAKAPASTDTGSTTSDSPSSSESSSGSSSSSDAAGSSPAAAGTSAAGSSPGSAASSSPKPSASPSTSSSST